MVLQSIPTFIIPPLHTVHQFPTLTSHPSSPFTIQPADEEQQDCECNTMWNQCGLVSPIDPLHHLPPSHLRSSLYLFITLNNGSSWSNVPHRFRIGAADVYHKHFAVDSDTELNIYKWATKCSNIPDSSTAADVIISLHWGKIIHSKALFSVILSQHKAQCVR